MTKFVIRPLKESDETEWRRLWTAYLDFYESNVSETVYATTFARMLGDDPLMPSAFVASAGEGDGDPLIGLVHFFYHVHCWRVERVCYLQDFFADPSHRNTGVGRALIEAVYAQADKDGAPSVYWLTQEHNTRARQLYDRIGTATPFIKYVRS